jgi:transcriptional regulator with XRE-family HTH domain
MAIESPIRCLADNALRKYPMEVPQRLAKRAWSAGESVLRYDRMDSMNLVLPKGNNLSIPSGHLPSGNSGYADEMDVKAIRRLRLQQLIAEFGSQTALAEHIGVEQNYISRALRGGKGIGEDFAERLEKGTGKEPGWMSRLEKTGADWPFDFSRTLWDELPQERRLSLEAAFRAMISGAHAETRVRVKKKQA